MDQEEITVNGALLCIERLTFIIATLFIAFKRAGAKCSFVMYLLFRKNNNLKIHYKYVKS